MPETTVDVKKSPVVSVMTHWVTIELLNRIVSEKSTPELRTRIKSEVLSNIASLAGPSPTRVETILAETVALSLLALRTHEAHFASAESSGVVTIAQAKHYLRKIEHAQRRMESSLRTLATVRRLALPTVQVNLAQNQVNQVVAGGHPPAIG